MVSASVMNRWKRRLALFFSYIVIYYIDVCNGCCRFLTPVVAVGAVDLAPKLPWSSTFGSRNFQHGSALDIMELTGAPVFDSMFQRGQGGEEDARSYVRSLTELEAAPQMTLDAEDDDDSSGAGVDGFGTEWKEADADGEAESKLGAEAGAVDADPDIVGENSNEGVPPNEALVGKDAPEKDIVQAMGQEDEGAGVFGAVLHEPGAVYCDLLFIWCAFVSCSHGVIYWRGREGKEGETVCNDNHEKE